MPEPTFYLFAVPAVIFAGISRGGFGSAVGFAATPLLALILAPGEAIGLMLPLLMVMDLGGLRAYWRKWNGALARRLILGAVPGVALGAGLYGIADPDLFRFLIGVVALGFVAFQLARARGWLSAARRPLGSAAGHGWGFLAGLTSFISHAGGPPATVYLLSQKLTKTEFQATTVLVFWAINLVKLPPYLWLGIFTRDTLVADLTLVPVALAGVAVGVYFHRLVPEIWFFRLTYAFLTITGAKLVWDAVV